MRLSSFLYKAMLLAAFVLVSVGFMQRDLVTAAFQSNPYHGSLESVVRGEQIWGQYCLSCHGPDAVGDGPASALLPKRPKDLTMIAPSPLFPDGIVAYRIAFGKNTMPAWHDTLSSEQIWDLVSFIRSKSKR
ncbi:MAG: cytochrome c [Betaproteobacteria bacterium]|nr:cytochrome c [Betaproteobacteria bacterium]